MQLTGPGMEAFQGAQTMTVGGSHAPQHGATILQCAAQPGDSPQFYIQGGQVLVQGRARGIWDCHALMFRGNLERGDSE